VCLCLDRPEEREAALRAGSSRKSFPSLNLSCFSRPLTLAAAHRQHHPAYAHIAPFLQIRESAGVDAEFTHRVRTKRECGLGTCGLTSANQAGGCARLHASAVTAVPESAEKPGTVPCRKNIEQEGELATDPKVLARFENPSFVHHFSVVTRCPLFLLFIPPSICLIVSGAQPGDLDVVPLQDRFGTARQGGSHPHWNPKMHVHYHILAFQHGSHCVGDFERIQFPHLLSLPDVSMICP
jgi:hypothetical protein